MRPKALDSVFVASDSSLQRFTGAVSTNHDWEKPSCCRPWDEYSKHSLPQLFRFFPRFPSSIRQEIPLLVYLDPLDCIDAKILKLSWFLVFIFIVLCSTFQYGCSSWVFGVIQFEMGVFRLYASRLVYFSQNFEEKILIFHVVLCPPPHPPRPRCRFRVIPHLKLVTSRGKWCDPWHLNHTSVGLTWGNILVVNSVNRQRESHLRSNMFFILFFAIFEYCL